VALRSTASQMQRGSGELQSTPTGFWKLQSDPACDGHGSIAVGIGVRSFLRSASLMGCPRTHTHTHTHTHYPQLVDDVQNESSSGTLLSVKSLNAPSPGSTPSRSESLNPKSSTSQPPNLSHTLSNPLRGAEAPGQQTEEFGLFSPQTHTENH